MFVGAPVPLEGKGASDDKNEYNFFLGNEVSNGSSYNHFFEDSIILWEKKIYFGREGGGTNITIFYVKTIDNTIETIDGFAKTIDSKNYR